MTPVERALQEIRGYTWLTVPNLPIIERYILDGDTRSLSKLTPVGSTGSFWGGSLADALARPDKWSDQDRRAVHVLNAVDLLEDAFTRLDKHLPSELPEEDLHGIVLREITGRTPETLAILTGVKIWNFARGDTPTSAGRFLLALPDKVLRTVALNASIENYHDNLLQFLIAFAKDRVPPIAQHLLDKVKADRLPSMCRTLLLKGGKPYETPVAKKFNELKAGEVRFLVGVGLAAFAKNTYGTRVLEAGRAAMSNPGFSNVHETVSTWMIENYPDKSLSDVVRAIERQGKDGDWHKRKVVEAAAAHLGGKAVPILLAALKSGEVETKIDALTHLTVLDFEGQRKIIHAEISVGLDGSDSATLIKFINLASRWQPAALEEKLWSLLRHKSKPVRAAAARAIGRLGEGVIPKAKELFADRKADPRLAAVTILRTVDTADALKELEARLDVEEDDDVRDMILQGLESAWDAAGRKITLEDVRKRISRSAGKIAEPPAKWIRFDKLPALKYVSGKRVEPDAVLYLLYRQSRAKEIRPDLEAKPLFALIDRKSSGDFALEILRGFLASGASADDQWALTIAGLLGDDRVVTILVPQIREWAEKARGKLAEYAVQALALLATDQALLAVDAMAIRFRTKNKNIGKAAVQAFAAAAEAAGLTPDELGDRVVPWLGFEPGKPRIIDAAKRKIQVSIGLDFKLNYVDTEAKKTIKSLPKTAPPAVLAEFKELAAGLREIVKAQLLRIENLMVRQRRWPADTWKKMFLAHPLLVPFGVRLVWGAQDAHGRLGGTFRALEDLTLTDAQDNEFILSKDASVEIVHPLELDEPARKRWIAHLADHEIEPPLPQLERPVVLVQAEQRDLKTYEDLRGTSLNAMTFKGRAERLGWSRGSVVDGGGITCYWKGFPAAEVDVLLGLDGMYIGIDMYSNITLGSVNFVRGSSVKFGSYTYDDPGSEKDPRVLPFGEVPAIVFSEAMGDLQKVAGSKAAQSEEA